MGREREKKERIPGFIGRLELLRGDRDNTVFAKHVGLSRQTLGYYLNGNRLPDAENIVKICKACNVSAGWLLGIEEEPSPDQDIKRMREYTGLSDCAINALRSFDLQLVPSSKKTINAVMESETFPYIVESLSTFLWGISYTEQKNIEGCSWNVSMAPSREDWERFGEYIRDAMILRITTALSEIRKEVSDNGKT